jgi:hypothetical protein
MFEAGVVCAGTLGGGCLRLAPAMASGINMIAQGTDGVLNETNEGRNFAVEILQSAGLSKSSATLTWGAIEVSGGALLLTTNVAKHESWIRLLPNSDLVKVERVLDTLKSHWSTLGGIGRAAAAGGMIFDGGNAVIESRKDGK